MFNFQKFAAVFAVATAAVVLSGTAVHAQGLKPVQKPFTVKIGGAFFTNKDVKDGIGSSTFSLGLVYDFTKANPTNPLIISGYFDYLPEKSKTRNGVKAKASLFAVGPQVKYLFAPAGEKTGTPYAFAGIGAYFVNAKADGNGTSVKQDSTHFGGKIGLGYELPVGVLGEIEYDFISKQKNVDPSNFQVRIGYRF